MRGKFIRSQLSSTFLERRSGIIKLALIGAIIAGIFATLPHNFFAHAAGPTITLNPTSASFAVRSVQVQGSGYAANESVNVYWDYTGPGTGTLEATVTTNAQGGFVTKISFPFTPGGNYTIGAVGKTSGRVATAVFNLTPQLTVSPWASGVTSPIKLVGNAFGATETVKFYFNYAGPGTGTLFGTVTSKQTGSFTVNATVPAGAIPGHVTIAAIGQSSNMIGTCQFLLYPPTLAVAPLSGSSGTTVTLSAYGFQAFENVTLLWKGKSTGLSNATNTFGYMAPITFTIPAATQPGAYQLSAVGASSNLTITNTYTVVAAASILNVNAGPSGASVAISGQGYAPGEAVTIFWGYTGPGTGTQVGSVTAGFSGIISGKFTIPSAVNGAYMVAAVGAASNLVSQDSFSVTNGLALSASTASPNTNITVVGAGFQAGESVALYLDSSSGASLGTAIADNKGDINQPVTVPSSANPGVHSVVGVGQVSNTSFSSSLAIDTSWGDFGFDQMHHRMNPSEFTLTKNNVASLQLKWSATISQGLQSSPVYANGLVYITTTDGKLDAYNATTGALKWQFDSQTGLSNVSSPLVDPATGIVSFGVVGHFFTGIPSPYYALDAQTGVLKWSILLPWNEFAFPTLALNTIYVGTAKEGSSATMFAIDEVSGHINWKVVTSSSLWGAVAVDTSTNSIFTGEGNPANAVLALNASTGAQLWQYSVPNSPGDLDVGAGVDVANGLVYASSKNGSVYALHENDGSLAWTVVINNSNHSDVSAPAYASSTPHGVIYVGGVNNSIDALDATNGSTIWVFKTSGPVYSSPAVANGIVYFSVDSKTTNFYALDASNASILWSSSTGGASYSSPIVIDGWLYYGTVQGNLYAFSL